MNVKTEEVSYTTATVEKGTLVTYVSGTGQVSASDQVDINPKVAGDLTALNITVGQIVKEGDLLAQIDSHDATRKVEEARASLENAKLELEELLNPTDSLTLIQAENSLQDAEETLIKLKNTQSNSYDQALFAKQKAEDNLEESYEDAYTNVGNAFLDLPDIITGLYTILYSTEISDSNVSVNDNANNSVLVNSYPSRDYLEQDNFKKYLTNAEESYQKAKIIYDKSFTEFKNIGRYSEENIIENILAETITTGKQIADAIKSETNMLDLWVEYRVNKDFYIYSDVSQYQIDLNSYTSKINNHISSLLSVERYIKDYKVSIAEADSDLREIEKNNPLELAAANRSLVEKNKNYLICVKAPRN